jgi:hypothetical protein
MRWFGAMMREHLAAITQNQDHDDIFQEYRLAVRRRSSSMATTLCVKSKPKAAGADLAGRRRDLYRPTAFCRHVHRTRSAQ